MIQRFKKDYGGEELLTLMNFENVSIFAFHGGDARIADFTVTDTFFLITLFSRDKYFEHESLMSIEPEALNGGHRPFLTYAERSNPGNGCSGLMNRSFKCIFYSCKSFSSVFCQ